MRALAAILRRDLMLAVRAGGGAGQGLAFFFILVLVVPLGVGPDSATLARLAPGMLWVGALLATLLGLDRLFQPDFEDGSLDVLALSPLPLEALVLVKALAHWLATGLPLAVMAVPLGVTLNLAPAAWPILVAALLAGTPALSLIGAFGAALTLGLRRGGLLLSIIVLPLYVPTLIFGARAVALAAEGQPALTALALLAGMTLLSAAVAPVAAAAAIRVQLG
jgi:heme exporter protein B